MTTWNREEERDDLDDQSRTSAVPQEVDANGLKVGSAAETAARLAAGGRVHALAQRYRRPVARGLRALR